MPRKLNLGCGFDRRDGFLNVDSFDQCDPDLIVDIEKAPWPFDDDAFDFVLIRHVLEHVGATFVTLSVVLKELYRVTADGAEIEIRVPHFRHDSFWTDPTHVRAYTLNTFEMLSRRKNEEWIRDGANVTMLARMLDVDFELIDQKNIYDRKWAEKAWSGEMTAAEVSERGRHYWNVIQELHVTLRTVKQ